MSAGVHRIDIEQGGTYSQRFVWKINKNPVDLTGYTARMQVRTDGSNRTRPNVTIISLTDTSGITLGTTDGTIQLDIRATDTSKLIPGTYSYRLELESASGFVTRLLTGACYVSPWDVL